LHYDYIEYPDIKSTYQCSIKCDPIGDSKLVGFEIDSDVYGCRCLLNDGVVNDVSGCPDPNANCVLDQQGSGPIVGSTPLNNFICKRNKGFSGFVSPTSNPTKPGDTNQPTVVPPNPVASTTVFMGNFLNFVEISQGNSGLGSLDCTSPTFVEVVEKTLRSFLRRGLPLVDQIISLDVSDLQASACKFPFNIAVRSSVKCDTMSCDIQVVGKETEATVANQINNVVTKAADDTSIEGFAKVLEVNLEKEDIIATGLTVQSFVETTQNVRSDTELGETITVSVMTDDHPEETKWSLIDACNPIQTVFVSELYTENGTLFTSEFYSRKTKYLFNMLDLGLDGVCCNSGPEGYFEVSVDNVVQFKFGDSGPFVSENEYFGDCYGRTTSKPTENMPTSQPTHVPTGQPTHVPTGQPTHVPTGTPTLDPTTSPTDAPTTLPPTSSPTSSPTPTDKVLVLTEIVIQFDKFPEDITWKLFRDCNNVKELLGEDGPYNNPGDVDKLVTVFNEMLEEGLFLFEIFDSYGDGLCCEQGIGYFEIVYGSTIIKNEFRVTSGEQDANEERVEFGQETENCLAPTSEPTSNPTFSPTSDPTSNPTSSPTSSPTSDPTIARFNATLGVPLCAEEAVKCEAASIINGPGLLEWKNAANQGDTPELNGPNTLDGCADGTSGLYVNDESVDAILVESLNTPMSNLRAGGRV